MIKYTPQWLVRNGRNVRPMTTNFYEDEGDADLLEWAATYGQDFNSLSKKALRQMMEAEQRGPPAPTPALAPAPTLTAAQIRQILREELHGLAIAPGAGAAKPEPTPEPEAEPQELDDELKTQLLAMF